MAFENGVNWQPVDPHLRGRHASFGSALDAAVADLLTEKNAFFDSLVDRWNVLFPDLPAKPGRWEDGTLWLHVRNSAAMYSMRPRLARVKAALAALPGAPKKMQVKLRIHTPGVAVLPAGVR